MLRKTKKNTINSFDKNLLEAQMEVLRMELYETHEEKKYFEKILNIIFSSKAYMLWQIYATLNQYAKKTIKYNVKNRIQWLTRSNKNEQKYIKNITFTKSTKFFDDVSIVIPTLNGAEYLENLFTAIRMQEGIQSPEIIIIDSGSIDKTVSIARRYHAKVISIDKKDFNHGLTRNIGAEVAKGKYIIFAVQDALPIDNYTYVNLLTLLSSEDSIIGVSTKQTPYPDADLFAKWQMIHHNSALYLNNSNYISKLPKNINFYSLPFILKRKISLFDDVCSCVKRDNFIKLGGYRKIEFAEDIEFAIRALKQGYKIGFTGQSGVIHSHTRSITYFFKRYYVDTKTVYKLFREKVNTISTNPQDLLQTIYILYLLLQQHFQLHPVSKNIPEYNELIKIKINNNVSNKYKSEFLQNLENISHLLKIILISRTDLTNKYMQITYSQVYNVFNDATKLMKGQIYSDKQIIPFFEKLMAIIVSNNLVFLTLDKKNPKREELENNLDSILSKDV